MLTTFDLDQYVYAALAAGASGFLLKDVTPEQLVAAVRLVRSGDALLAPSITRRLVERFAAPRPGDVRRAPGPGGADPARAGGAAAARPGAEQRRARRRVPAVARRPSRPTWPGSWPSSQLRDRVQAVVVAYETGLVAPGEA